MVVLCRAWLSETKCSGTNAAYPAFVAPRYFCQYRTLRRGSTLANKSSGLDQGSSKRVHPRLQ